MGERGELEDRVRELPRVLPLPDRASRLQRDDGRLARRVPARGGPDLFDPAGAAAPRRRQRLRPRGRGRAGTVPLRLARARDQHRPRQAEPLDRAGAARRASRTRRFLDYFFAPGADDAWIDDLLAFDNQVGAEDTVLVEGVQRGVSSGGLERGALLPRSEVLIADFQQRVAAALAA
ncbi:MAG: SRPBCC family protein [Gaiellaceae bacterium]